jgi:hypothetical protein
VLYISQQRCVRHAQGGGSSLNPSSASLHFGFLGIISIHRLRCAHQQNTSNLQSERDKEQGPIEDGRRPEEEAAEAAGPTRRAACGHAGEVPLLLAVEDDSGGPVRSILIVPFLSTQTRIADEQAGLRLSLIEVAISSVNGPCPVSEPTQGKEPYPASSRKLIRTPPEGKKTKTDRSQKN